MVKRSADRSDDPPVIWRSSTLPPRCLAKARRTSGHVGSHAQCDGRIGKMSKNYGARTGPMSMGAVMPGLVSPSRVVGQVLGAVGRGACATLLARLRWFASHYGGPPDMIIV